MGAKSEQDEAATATAAASAIHVEVPKEFEPYLTINDSSVSIAEGAFRDSWYLVTVTFTEGLKNIGDGAFENCAGLVSVNMVMASTLRQIGAGCFSKCSSLENVRLPPWLERIPENAFSECESLGTIDIPSTVYEIGKNAFYRCISMANVSFAKNSRLQTIGVGAFKCCLSLRHIHLPCTVQSIGKNAFISCVRLLEINVPFGVKAIEDHTFFFCEKLKKISVPPTVTTIGTGAFQDCRSLVAVVDAKGVQVVGERAFKHCKELLMISTSPAGLVSIGDRALLDCHKLIVQIDLQDGLKEIPERAFAHCKSLMCISVPKSVNTIGKGAFRQCKNLIGVELPTRTKLHIGDGAFQYCDSLATISIDESYMSNVSMDTFSKCKTLITRRGRWDLMELLQDRYADLPVHEACYRASQTTVDDLMAVISRSDVDASETDFCGLTPFHVLATSAKVRTDLLEVLLDHYPAEVIWKRDRNNSDMMGYIFRKQSADAKSFVKMVLQKTVLNVMDGWGIEKWRRDMRSQLESITSIQGRQRWKPELLHDVLRALARYTKLEITSLLDLILWKWALDSLQMDRADCLSLSRAEIVIPNVTSFLWDDSSRPSSIIFERSNKLDRRVRNILYQ